MRRRQRTAIHEREVTPLINLWILRLLVPLGGRGYFVRALSSENISKAIGLRKLLDKVGSETEKDMLHGLEKLHAQAEARSDNRAFPLELEKNLEALKDLVGLSDVDARILGLGIILHTDRLLDDTGDMLGIISASTVSWVISGLLEIPETQVRESLSGAGVLAKSGLLTINRESAYLRAKIELLSDQFAELMLRENEHPIDILKGSVAMGLPTQLKFDDFRHVGKTLEILRPYLARSIESRRVGVNVLIYGAPGTGKSELVRLLSQDVSCPLYEVANENREGDPVDGEQRLRALRAAQCFFSRQKALLVFDEAEDVFNDGDGLLGKKSTAQTRKAWMNRMLEVNPVPTIWLSNSARCLDPAFIRRFDVVLEMGLPPRSQRKDIIDQACKGLLSETAKQRLAGLECLTPAIVTRAASVVGSLQGLASANQSETAVECLIEGVLAAQGHASAERPGQVLPDYYDARLLNVDADLQAVADGVAASGTARICLYGPPGTGKSAFARWLAERLNRPLRARRVSDIVSAWLGETEKALAREFRQAEREGAVLVLDEVDSFLRDRRSAQRSWEVTEVNEMLTQLENFNGVLVASTNLIDGLDAAAMRRFDLKLHFGYLRGEQAWALLQRQCRTLGIGEVEHDLRFRLERLDTLTPGDFAVVARQHRLRPFSHASGIVAALAAECQAKNDRPMRAIGFC